jgi:hypothetical protein
MQLAVGYGLPHGQEQPRYFFFTGSKQMHDTSLAKKFGWFFLPALLLLVISGCAGNFGGKSSGGPQTVSFEGEPGAVSTTVESYGDIELPIEMTLEQDKSMAMRTDSFQGGIHVYRGRVEINSLRDYIIVSMRNNKWKLVGEASYKNVMLAFTKPNRTCMVVLSDDQVGVMGKTQANLYVTVDVAAANRLNPFGEPIRQ